MAQSAVPRLRSRSGSDQGATAVEFALLLPLLAVLIFGLVDMGRLFYVQMALEFAANEGARVSSLYPNGPADTATVPNAVKAAVGDAAIIAKLDGTAVVSIDPAGANTCKTVDAAGNAVNDENTTVLVSTPFVWLIPAALFANPTTNGGVGNTITLSATGVLRCIG